MEEQEACDNCRQSREGGLENNEENNNEENSSEKTLAGVEKEEEEELGVGEWKEYSEQAEQRERQRGLYRQSRMAAAEKVLKLSEILASCRLRCMRCRYYGEEDEHRMEDCEGALSVLQDIAQVKKRLRYARYAAC